MSHSATATRISTICRCYRAWRCDMLCEMRYAASESVEYLPSRWRCFVGEVTFLVVVLVQVSPPGAMPKKCVLGSRVRIRWIGEGW